MNNFVSFFLQEEGGEKAVDSIKRKIMDNPDSLGPPAKKMCKAPITNLPQGLVVLVIFNGQPGIMYTLSL